MTQSKSCSGCGASFACGRNDADCWCTALPRLPATALDDQADCYCPRCLTSIVAARRDQPPSSEPSTD